MEESFKYSIDALIARRNSIFGFGWIFHPTLKIANIYLLLKSQNDTTQHLPISYGKYREDVANTFPNIEHAKSAGFIIYGGYKSFNNIKAELEILTEDNNIHKLIIPIKYLDNLTTSKKLLNAQYHIYGVLAKRFISLLQQGIGFRNIIEKIKRYLTTMPKKTSNQEEEIVTIIRKNNIKRVILMVDHDLGGGANKYRQTIVQTHLQNHNAILLLTYHVLSLQYVVELQVADTKRRYALDTLETLFQLADTIGFSEIFYNTAVSFEKPELIPIVLTNLAKIYGIQLTVAVNDYFMICPSHFLLDDQGKYCDIPDIKTCQTCLKKNKEGFITLFEEADIVAWRKNWSNILKSANRIICFSNSSKTILQKVYPFLTDDYFDIKPHNVEKPLSYAVIDLTMPLNIGIVGHINIHKGAKIVQELSHIIKNKKLPIKISIIGTMELSYDPNIIYVTGSYKTKDLSRLIEKTKANIFFMPSICPETFSYVTQELILLNVPLISFDIGAQGERIKQYSKGTVIPYGITAEEILLYIQKFYERLRNS